MSEPFKPLGQKAYGSIGHLPGSRRGPADKGVNDGQARICWEKVRDKHDTVIVQEKLDGSNVSVAKVDGVVMPLIRAGYRAETSTYEQHRLFAIWAYERQELFDKLLRDGERICGEWLAQAHSTQYDVDDESVFVAFDIMTGYTRLPFLEFMDRVCEHLPVPSSLIHPGEPCPLARAAEHFGEFGRHKALDPIEGYVWRVERKGKVDFLAKHVHDWKVDGRYFPENNGGSELWNWRPSKVEVGT